MCRIVGIEEAFDQLNQDAFAELFNTPGRGFEAVVKSPPAKPGAYFCEPPKGACSWAP